MHDNVKLIYIAGSVRSGTTVLEYLLSDHPHNFSIGELNKLEDFINRGKIGSSCNWACSCGYQLEKCSFWSPIIHKFCEQKKNLETRTSSNKPSNKNNQIAGNCWDLILSATKKADKRNVIDSSKDALQLHYLNKTKDQNEIKTIFIIRDSRAVNFSKLKWKMKFHGYNNQIDKIKGYYNWLKSNIKIVNVIAAANISCFVLNYDGLAKDTNKYLQEIFDFLGQESFSKEKAHLNVNGKHTIAGTPNKFKFHNTPVEYDSRWTKEVNLSNSPFNNLFGVFCNTILWLYVSVRLHKKY